MILQMHGNTLIQYGNLLLPQIAKLFMYKIKRIK